MDYETNNIMFASVDWGVTRTEVTAEMYRPFDTQEGPHSTMEVSIYVWTISQRVSLESTKLALTYFFSLSHPLSSSLSLSLFLFFSLSHYPSIYPSNRI